MTMVCPKCKKSETKVIDSREANASREIRRRRECAKCHYRFSTLEKIVTTNFIVVKKDGSREPYNRDKIEKGIWRACEKRPVTEEQVARIITDLEEEFAGMGKEIQSRTIGEELMEKLRKLDHVAYIRFASVYRHFKDVESFKREVAKLLK